MRRQTKMRSEMPDHGGWGWVVAAAAITLAVFAVMLGGGVFRG